MAVPFVPCTVIVYVFGIAVTAALMVSVAFVWSFIGGLTCVGASVAAMPAMGDDVTFNLTVWLKPFNDCTIMVDCVDLFCSRVKVLKEASTVKSGFAGGGGGIMPLIMLMISSIFLIMSAAYSGVSQFVTAFLRSFCSLFMLPL